MVKPSPPVVMSQHTYKIPPKPIVILQYVEKYFSVKAFKFIVYFRYMYMYDRLIHLQLVVVFYRVGSYIPVVSQLI